MGKFIIKIINWFNVKPRINILFYVALLSLVFPLIHYQAYASDLWKALYSGRYLALNWSFPSHAEFTFSPVADFVVHDGFNWLGNLVFFGLYQIGGIVALQIVIRMGLVIFAIILTHSIINYKINPLVLLILFFLVVNQFQKLHLRTAIFLIPFMVIFWWLWDKSREKGKWRWLFGFPVLFLFWGNMHGSYLYGFGFLVILFTGDFIDRFLEKDHPGWPWLGRLAMVIVVSFLILTFVKPFPDYLLTTKILHLANKASAVFVPSPEPSYGTVKENSVEIKTDKKTELRLYEKTKRFLQNLFINKAYEKRLSAEFSFPADHLRNIYVLPSFLIIAVTLSGFIINYRAITAREFLIWLSAGLLGVAYLRSVAVITLVMIPLLFIKSKRGDFKNIEIGRRVQIVAMIGCVLVASNLWYLIGVKKTSRALGTSFYRAGFGKHPRFSDSVPEYALEKYPGKNGYNHYNYGTYLIWKWWPDKRVFVDSKSSAYKPEFMKKYKNTYDFNLIEEYELDHAITSYRQQLPYTHLIPHPEWEIKAMDEGFILFEKVDQAVSKKPSEYLLLSSKELNRLQPREKKQLKEVMEFIKSNQNDEDKVGRYFSINSWESAKNK